MKVNYHTHTWRCGHASGTEREYIEYAIEMGYRVLGFADHTPYPFPKDYESEIRMKMEQLEEYADTIRKLKHEYQGEIEIRLGLETEYYPAYFPELQRAAKKNQIEYFLLAQHFLGNEIGEYRSCEPTEDVRILKRYCSQLIEGMKTGYFTYVAHPDLIHFIGDSSVYEQEMRKICRQANQLELPLEINFVGLSLKRNYPDERFWRIAGEEGCAVVFGVDAHNPGEILKTEAVQAAENLVKKYNLHLTEEISLRQPW